MNCAESRTRGPLQQRSCQETVACAYLTYIFKVCVDCFESSTTDTERGKKK